MKFPWHKYKELPLERRNTLQIFITNACNLKCGGCFVRKVMDSYPLKKSVDSLHMSMEEFKSVLMKAAPIFDQINLLGGEPLLHPQITDFVRECVYMGYKITIYTNGSFLTKWHPEELKGAKLRISAYSFDGGNKAVLNIPADCKNKMDLNFMVGANTTVDELIDSAYYAEKHLNCSVFFISSIRELDNKYQDFFYDTDLTMPVIQYKWLVHKFIELYEGKLDIHVSKRGVFESTKSLPSNKCNFSNYFIGGKIIYCPYDVVNLKFVEDDSMAKHIRTGRTCRHNNTCLMSKVIYRPKRG